MTICHPSYMDENRAKSSHFFVSMYARQPYVSHRYVSVTMSKFTRTTSMRDGIGGRGSPDVADSDIEFLMSGTHLSATESQGMAATSDP
jgi:hypothetical protein